MTRFCSVSGNIYPSQEGFCSSCGIALKKPTFINVNAIPSLISLLLPSSQILPLTQDRVMYILALLASRSIAGYAILAANACAQKGSIPSAGQLALSAQANKAVTRISYCTMVSLFTIAYYFKFYKDEVDNIRTYGAINCESK
jgi:hypothetical protein